MKNYESPFKDFRDMNKSPDMYPHNYANRTELKAMLNEADMHTKSQNTEKEIKAEKKDNILTPVGQAFKITVDLVNSAKLLPEFENNEAEAKIIEQRREVILGYLARILEDSKNYLSQINVLQVQTMAEYDDIEKYQAVVGGSDALRKTYHNRLIGDVKIASRLININFNADYPEDLRLQEEEKMPDRKGMSRNKISELMKQREYFKFPAAGGSFIDFSKAPKDPSLERKYIASWSFKLYADLSALTEEIKKTPAVKRKGL